MEKIKGLNGFQKGIFLVMLAMVLIFTGVYSKTVSRVGYLYRGEILVQTQEKGNTIFSGKVQGEEARFIVSDDDTVAFRYGEKSYGSYCLREDPTAIPKNAELAERMTGIEILHEGELLFRGGALALGDSLWLYNEDGTLEDGAFPAGFYNGTETDETGSAIERMEPSAATIYELLHDPELTHKGELGAWFGGVFVCILNTLSILFVDELFRWNLSFRIRHAENAEASDWEIISRYLSWGILPILALALFWVGLE